MTKMSVENTKQLPSTSSQAPKFGKRHIQILLITLMMAIAIGMRLILSIAIVAMNDSSTSPNPNIPTFNWKNKSVVLSSFYWGYVTLQLLAGSLGRKYGTKRFLIGAMTVNSIFCIITPLTAIKFGSYGVIVCRIFQGISQGFFFPSVFNLLGRWAPVAERSRLGTLALAGYSFGSIIGQPVAGYLSSSWLGWPSCFYLYGTFGLIWTFLWTIFGANSPAEHSSIQASEREYIESSLGTEEDEASTKVPWKYILLSKPMWGLTLYGIGMSFGSSAISTETPIYMNKVLGFNIEWNSLLSTVSSIAALLSSFIFAHAADFCINNGYLTRGFTRKSLCTINCLISSIGLGVLCLLPSDAVVSSVLMFGVIGFALGAIAGGPGVNQIDLSPRFAGVLQAITNTTSSIFSFVGPLVVQFIVQDEADKSQWSSFFYITIAMFLFANIVFVVFGSGELQPWDTHGMEKSKQDDIEKRRRKLSKKLSIALSINK